MQERSLTRPFFLINIGMTNFSRPGLATVLRSPRTASRVFGLDTPGQYVRAVPRMKFMFAVNFIPSRGGNQMMDSANLNTYLGNRGMMFKVRQIDKPKLNLVTADLNQYNKKKVVYTKVEYSEATMRLYDSVDNSVLSWWVDYFTYYYGDSRLKTSLSYSQSPVDPSFTDSTGWGFRPLIEDTEFFEKITVFAFYANTYTAFSYINPKITTVNWQQKDYSGNEPEEVDVSFKYEMIQYEKFGERIQNPSEFGWSDIDQLPVNMNSAAAVVGLTVPQPRLFSNQNNNEYVEQTVTPSQSPPEPSGEVEQTSAAPGATPPVAVQTGSVFPGSTGMNFGGADSVNVVRRNSTTITPVTTGTQSETVPAISRSLELRRYERERNAQAREVAEQAGLVTPGENSTVRGRFFGGVLVGVTVNGQYTDLQDRLTPEERVRADRAYELLRQNTRSSRVLSTEF